jgi:hypothetical protein
MKGNAGSFASLESLNVEISCGQCHNVCRLMNKKVTRGSTGRPDVTDYLKPKISKEKDMNEQFEFPKAMQPVENRELTDVEGGVLVSCLPRLSIPVVQKPPIGFPSGDLFVKYTL